MMDSLQSTAACYCSPVPEECCPLPADDDAVLWDSLWRLVDGDGCGDGDGDGSSGGDY
jgi:transcription factor MYB, plant